LTQLEIALNMLIERTFERLAFVNSLRLFVCSEVWMDGVSFSDD